MPVPRLPIVTYPAAVLAKPTDRVETFDQSLHRLIKRMVPTMRDADGIGLAANQVGLNQALAVIEYLPRGDRRRRSIERVPLHVMINPRIIESGQETDELSEGCLSCPGLELLIRRPTSIVVEYQTPDGKMTTKEVRGFPARIYQHEIDHLHGRLILDRAEGQRALVDAYRANPNRFQRPSQNPES